MTFTSLCANTARQGAARAVPGAGPHGPRGGEALPPGKNPSSNDDKYSTADAPRILIVEDLLLVAWHLESLARELDYEVCGLATDGQDAIEQAADSAANVLLMDVNLGEGMDGIEAARRIRETAPAAVVFVTAYNSPPYVERIEQAFPGAPILAKPVTRERLRAAVVAARKRESG
jgi:DNA-binding NarL/FixJ family response regulator